MLDPIARLQDNFQLTDLPAETGAPSANLRAADEKFARTRGLLSVRQN
jgi:hypothetical protein